ncbi:MAG: peptidase [Cyanobacteria bacterium RYN_339]|nr:peptidase [Cyanobacteria bacterium RYN_339]
MKLRHLSPAALALMFALSACGAHPTGVTAVKRGAVLAESKGVLQAKGVAGPPEIVAATEADKPLSVKGSHEIDKFSFKGTTYHLLSVDSAGILGNVLGSLRATAGVRMADANAMTYALDAELPNDEFYPMQYGLAQKNVAEAWKITMGDPNLIVGVVDTGIDYNHPDLKDKVIKGTDFTFRPGWIFHRKDVNGPMDDNQHGTHCAGIIGATANNETGIAGVAPNVKLMAVKSLDAAGRGTEYDVMKGVAYAVTNGAKIVSLSLGGTGTTSVERKFYEAAVQSGCLVVAAAGNNGDALGFPASYPGVLSVGASDSGGALAKFSNHDASMGVTAPGVGILSTVPGNSYEKMSGTSMAAPFVAGVAALVWSAHPDWTAQEVMDRIESTADDKGAPGIDAQFGHGEVNLLAALQDSRR